jgi:pteridine reductase|tara:strand:+ start:153 stop:884 length:732 start_codon:yes stop_codon:yes gene_type:complete
MTSKFIFLTGGAKRIGKTTCKHFHDEGFNIIFHYNTSDKEANEIKESLNSIRKDSCFVIQADFNDKSSIERLAEGVAEITDELAVLINNASSFYPTPIEQASQNEWDDLMATNATTPLFLTQALLPFLKKAKGCVINISDTLAPSGIKNFSLYSGAKSALEGITKSLAKELAPDIRVNAISPGAILWPEDEDLTEEQQKERLSKVPLGRIGSPEDISSVAVFLTDAKYITGQVIKVDGGRSVI